ncbi:MAG TPA: GNAT family N-acetyltransferase [Candidatus Acidoferrum sp.]|nr:GNAT family N-acetyltransferase [Candidatus Acidoferrum sp.]
MDLDLDALKVVHNGAENRFEIALGNELALLTYRRRPDCIVYNHTEVPRAFEGRGIAGKLTRAGLDYARSQNLHVVPTCPYIADFIRKHPEYQDLLAPEDLRRYVTG